MLIQKPIIAQVENEGQVLSKDTALVNSLLKESATHYSDNRVKAEALAIQAKELAQKLDFVEGLAYSLKTLGIVKFFDGKYLEALDYYNQSLKIFHDIEDNVGISNLYSNIGVIYYDQADYTKALENYLQSLKYAELANNKLRILTALNNVGGVYSIKPATKEKALEYYLKALPLCEELGNKDALGAIAVNIGNIYFDKGDHKKALDYFNQSLKAYNESNGSQYAYSAIGKMYLKEGNYNASLINLNKALSLSEKLNDDISIVQTFTGLGNLFVVQGDYPIALSYYKKAESYAANMPVNDDIKDLYKAMAATFEKSDDYHNAYKYQSLFSNIKDSIYNIASDKKLTSLQFDFDLQKKEGEIKILTKDKALNELQLQEEKFARNAFAAGLALVFLIAILIFRNYRAKVKTNKILDHQKDQIEHLLLNILPAEVAKELRESGYSTPREYEMVSVLFTDFKSFTLLTSNMPPQELVEELNTWFMAFDNIISKYNLEKIKTIGDSYMCAGGIPTPDDQHPYNIVKAGLEIQEHIISQNEIRKQNGKAPWDLRIGIHVGPLVAGVVGRMKYAYDIWGSTVNIASRMESNSEAGRVNISAQTYALVKDNFNCSYRGKIYAKNVGEVDMYFVEQEIIANQPTIAMGKEVEVKDTNLLN
ncbi:MAG: adenylate/guanylate cyclase domain-containing protein [Ginsengibacter sp.]